MRPAASEQGPYERAWRNYRWRLATPPGVLVGLILGFPFLIDLVGPTAFGVAWLVAPLISFLWLMSWRCPRCSNPFFRNVIQNPSARRCMHCGLPRWAKGPGPE